VTLNNPQEMERKSNMKVFNWAFSRASMEGTWDFTIEPDITADMLDEDKKATTIRYGCAILVKSKSPARAKSLTLEMYNLNKKAGVLL